jgi:hypothetical protein
VGHKNQRVRENILALSSRLALLYGADLRALPQLPPALAVMLGDQQGGVRQMAVSTMADLHGAFGDDLMVGLRCVLCCAV